MRTTILALKKKRTGPFSIFPDYVAIRGFCYEQKLGRPWSLFDITHLPEVLRIIFFDSLTTVDWPRVADQNGVTEDD